MADQRDVIAKLTEQNRLAIVDQVGNLADSVTSNYDTLMGQAADDLNQYTEFVFGGNGILNYTDYKRLQLDQTQLKMLSPYLNELKKKQAEDMEAALEKIYWEAYRRSSWAIAQTTPPATDITIVHDLTANPATDFYLQTFLKQQVMVPWKGAMFSQRLGVITDKMARNIQSLTDAGMVNGWSTQDLSLAIREEMGIPLSRKLVTRPRASAAKMRADMVARNEMMRSADLAKQYLFKQNAGIVKDEAWQTSDLGNVCDDCEDNEGELFSNLGERPPLHPRCACTGIPVLKSWGELLGPEYAGMKDEGIDEWEMKTRDPVSGKIASVSVQPFDEWMTAQ